MPNLEILNDKKIKEKLNKYENDNENGNENKDNNNMTEQHNIDNNENDNENEENANLIDLNDDEIKNISLQDEIPNFNDIYKKISLKFKSIQKNNDFKDEFQALIKNEINKINSNNDNNIPNYIYSSNVIESQLCIYSFFNKKFLEFLSTQNEKETYDLIKEIHQNISKSYLLLIKIIYKLYPSVNEKIQMLKMQLNEAIKHNNNVYLELNENENKIKQEMKNKEKLINNYEDKINYLESKIKQLENENNLMSEKLFSSVKNVMNNENKYPTIQAQNEYSNRNSNTNPNLNNNNTNMINDIQKFQDNNNNVFINSNMNNNINNNNYQNQYISLNNNNSANNFMNMNYKNNSYNNLNNSFNNINNNSLLQASPVCNRVFTIKMMKEIINDI